ncbi:MAG: metallophosphatase family protein [Cyclobacteriaceae bacterium]|nr:metallophosphatase family protein [Cyclobacteriaceae bacterium]
MKIGLLSDTHGFLDPAVFDYFKSVDEIWHAGDIGNDVVESLANFKPLIAVFGNIDDKSITTQFPEDYRRTIEGVDCWMTHIAGAPPNYNPRVRKILQQHTPQVLICGHSHILRVRRDPAFNNMLYINPGAAGHHGFHHMRTIVRFEIAAGTVSHMEVIDLGKRGALKQ